MASWLQSAKRRALATAWADDTAQLLCMSGTEPRTQLQAEDKAISASKFCLTHRHQQCKRVLKTMNHVSSSQLSNLVPLYLDMYWWGTGSTAGLMFIALSLEPNDILCIILLPIANQALPFQSTFQTGSIIIIFFFFLYVASIHSLCKNRGFWSQSC